MPCLRRKQLWQLALSETESPGHRARTDSLGDDGNDAANPDSARAHLASGCERCNQRLQTYRGILAALRGGPVLEPAAQALEKARRLADPAIARLHEWLAEPLQLDTGGLALRGLRISSQRQLFKAGPYEVDLARMDNGTLLGQVWATDAAAASPGDGACILFGEGDPVVVPIEPNGDFRIPRPPPGPYTLCLEVAGARIVVESTGPAEVQ